MDSYPRAAMERAMKVQDVILQAQACAKVCVATVDDAVTTSCVQYRDHGLLLSSLEDRSRTASER